MNFVSAIGKHTLARCRSAADALAFLGETLVEAVGMVFCPWRFRFGDFALAFERASFDGFGITIGIGFLLGVILAFQSAAALRMFGVEVYIADLLSIALFRELGPIITAVILAGRSGSAFAAEIGTMKVNEELDALSTMGLPPVRFLVMPRVVAATLAMPILTIFADLAGLIGGAIVLEIMRVPNSVYWRHVISITTPFMVWLGLAKAAMFGLMIGIIGCGSGMNTRATADGVGTSATAAVVWSIVAIAVSDGVLAVICFVWHL